MADPFLYELMNRAASSSKLKSVSLSGPLNEAFEKAIMAEVAAIYSEQKDSSLLSEEAALKKIESEVRKAAELTEFGSRIQHAVELIRSGQRYLEKEDFYQLNVALDEIHRKIESLDLINFTDESLKSALEVPDSAAQSILKIAIDKFSEGLLNDSLDVFSFLTLVCPDEPEYWYRMGLVAHKDGQNELALKAFEAASGLAGDFLESHVFAAECHIDLKEYHEAAQELEKAKNCLAAQENQEWADSIKLLEKMIEDREAV